MFQHFGQRLRKDLRSIVDTRLAASETASGGLMRSSGMEVSEYPLSLSLYCKACKFSVQSLKFQSWPFVFLSRCHFSQDATLCCLVWWLFGECYKKATLFLQVIEGHSDCWKRSSICCLFSPFTARFFARFLQLLLHESWLRRAWT